MPEQKKGVTRGEASFLVAIVIGLVVGMLIKRVRLGILLGLVIGGSIAFLGYIRMNDRSGRK